MECPITKCRCVKSIYKVSILNASVIGQKLRSLNKNVHIRDVHIFLNDNANSKSCISLLSNKSKVYEYRIWRLISKFTSFWYKIRICGFSIYFIWSICYTSSFFISNVSQQIFVTKLQNQRKFSI